LINIILYEKASMCNINNIHVTFKPKLIIFFGCPLSFTLKTKP